MALFTDEQLEALKNRRDSEGKILIDESMPEDLKQAIAFVNEHNIDLFNNSIDQLTPEELADEEEEIDPELLADIENNDGEFSPIEKVDYLEVDGNISDDELDDLNEFI